MNSKIAIRILVIQFTLLLLPLYALSGPSKVGNGDEGSDLEGLSPISQGPIVQARDAALRHLSRLNIQGIPGLGTLSAEIASSPLYLSKKDVHALLPEDEGRYHSSLKGLVYARTFARPHAETRFFPVAESLDQDQLIALHIHEALHRSLPEEIRENEAKVSKITLALSSPGASYDQALATIAPLIPRRYQSQNQSNESELPDRYPQPSRMGYELRVFSDSNSALLSQPVRQLHTLHSHLYPFGGKNNPIGLGIEFAIVKMSNTAGSDSSFKSGPLALSLRSRLWSVRGFDIGAWAQTQLNTLSNEELKNSALGRDTFTLGLTMQKRHKFLLIENSLGYTFQGESQAKLGQQEIFYEFGGVVSAQIKSGLVLGKLLLSGYADILLGDNLRIYQNDGENFDQSTGRYRIITAGPELAWMDEDFSLKLRGKVILNSTKDANLDFLGNLMGQGANQGEVSASISFHL